MGTAPEVRYFVLLDGTRPYLLGRVRWPDVAQGISVTSPQWRDDPGLFDLPYEPVAAQVTPADAATIATSWGAPFPPDAARHPSAPPIFRRMPANWAQMAPAEKRSWSLEFMTQARPAHVLEDGTVRQVAFEVAEPLGTRRQAPHRSFGRRRGHAEVGPGAPAQVLSPDGVRRPDGAAIPAQLSESIAQISGGAVDQLAGNGHDPSAPAPDRRRHPRVHIAGWAHIACGDKVVSADLVDVSRGGVRCVLVDPRSIFEIAGKIEPPLVIDIDQSRTQITLDVVPSVAWKSGSGPGIHLGLAFDDLDDEQAELIERLLVMSGQSDLTTPSR
jgi:hypothetical protein